MADKSKLTESKLLEQIYKLEAELKQLRQSNAKLSDSLIDSKSDDNVQTFFDLTAVSIFRCSVDGYFLEVNDAFVDLIGYTRDELLSGKLRWDQITPPEHRPVDEKAIKEIYDCGKAQPFEKEYVRKDGSRVPILLAVVASDNSGSDCYCFAVDLSRQKSKEAALRKSEAHFRLLADAIPQVVFTIDPHSQVEYFNKQWWDRTGLDCHDHPGDSWRLVVHPDDMDYAVDVWNMAVESGQPYEVQVRNRMADGSYRWVLSRALPLKDSSGNTIKWLGTSTDINAQKLATEALKASEARFRTLADGIPQIVWTSLANGDIDFFNHRFYEYTGLTVEQGLNDGWHLLIHPDDLGGYLSDWQQSIKSGETYEREFRLKRAAGLKRATRPYRKHLARAVPLKNQDGGILKWFATWTEIERI